MQLVFELENPSTDRIFVEYSSRACEEWWFPFLSWGEMLRKYKEIRNKLVEAGNREDETETEKVFF